MQRAIRIGITNNTSATWYRHMHTLGHGVWTAPPKEAIRPGAKMSCAAECTKSFSYYTGQLQYNIVLGGAEYLLCAHFDMPVLGESKSTLLLGCTNDYVTMRLPAPDKLFRTDHRYDDKVNSKFEIGVWETDFGKEYVHRCSEELADFVAAASMSASFPTAMVAGGALPCGSTSSAAPGASNNPAVMNPLAAISSIYNNAPRHFVWNVRNIYWQERMRKAHRSLLIRIVNLTSYSLVRSPLCKIQLALEEGIWDEFPSDQIPPQCFTEFGAHCDGIFTGTQGAIDYEMLYGTTTYGSTPAVNNRQGSQGRFRFWWAHPAIGPWKSGHKHSGKRFAVYKHGESFNEGLLIYHVIDPLDPPKMKIVSARAVPPQNAPTSRDWSRLGMDIISALFTYLNETTHPSKIRGLGDGDLEGWPLQLTSSEELQLQQQQHREGGLLRELNIVSPRAFFCAVQANHAILETREVVAGSGLFLEWQIGCESFHRIWFPDEKVWLNSGIVGGIEDKAVILRATVENIRAHPPLALYLSRQADIRHSTATAGGGLLDIAPAPTFDATRQQLLDSLLMVTRIFAQGVQPTVATTMNVKYGDMWHLHANLPRCNQWRDHTANHELSIDFEGQVYLLLTFWSEIFEDVFGSDKFPLLQELQVVATHWGAQDTSKFDNQKVFAFCQCCIALLQRVGAEQASDEIDKVMSVTFGTPLGAVAARQRLQDAEEETNRAEGALKRQTASGVHQEAALLSDSLPSVSASASPSPGTRSRRTIQVQRRPPHDALRTVPRSLVAPNTASLTRPTAAAATRPYR